MNKPRTLAYELAREFDLNELEKVSGGDGIRGKIFIPTVKVTGRPLIPDTECDSRYV